MHNAETIAQIREKYRSLQPEMDERLRRQWAATEARALGWGGVTTVARATGLSRTTITAGLRELDMPAEDRRAEAARVRRPGGGRRPLTLTDPQLISALESLVEPEGHHAAQPVGVPGQQGAPALLVPVGRPPEQAVGLAGIVGHGVHSILMTPAQDLATRTGKKIAFRGLARSSRSPTSPR